MYGGGGFVGGIHPGRFIDPNTHFDDVTFFGKTITTTVTADSSEVSSWISGVLRANSHRLRTLTVGLDVEWRPPFSPIPNPIATVQICVGRRCLIYQIIHSGGGIPRSLADFLSDDDFTFVGVGVREDLNKLRDQYGIRSGARAADLGSLAALVYGRPDLRSKGLKDLAFFLLGRNVEKPRRVTLSNWDNRRLTAEQVHYACVDAYVSYKMGRVLKAAEREV